MKQNTIIFLVIVFFISLSQNVSANTDTSEGSPQAENSYTISPTFGNSQKSITSNFYDMTLSPNQEDVFKLTIKNQSNKNQKFKINVNTATTNTNVIVDYTKQSFKKDSSMKVSIKDLITPNSSDISVAAGKSETVDFKIHMPEQFFDGILLGGITVKPIQEEQSSTGIQNVYMHTLAIRVNETDKDVPARIHGANVTIGQENQHNLVKMLVRNPEARLLSQMDGHFFITKKNSAKKLVQKSEKNLSIAPNSEFYVPLLLKDSFKAGNYTYTVKIKNKDGEWKFSKDFKISNGDAQKYNKTSLDNAESKTNDWLIYTIAFLIITWILIFVAYKLGKKRGSD
ncbi:DUF916 and DUF3324 domain-containing protein [Enterococcus gilvus]|uniref:DUF916 and DUF3324 domain-containing protein n=1 Tax=Enterococcus gilvus TaxID=160453 RepID=UPI0028CFEEAA|nr:DUF916 and DUF3324 domain-containing protein [Enterococcus gilvus]